MRAYLLVMALWCGLGARAQAEDLHIIAAGALPESLNAISQGYKEASGHQLSFFYGAVPAMVKEIQSGQPFDLAIVPVDMAQSEAVRRHLAAGPGTDIAQVGFSVAVRTGHPVPDVRTVEALKQTLLGASSLTFFVKSLGGEYILSVFDRLGIAQEMAAKTRPQTAPGQGASRLVQGEAEIAIDVTNGLTAPGVTLAGPLPAELQRHLVFRAVLSAEARHVGAAHDFIRYLKSPAAASVFRAKGIEPL